MTEAHQSIMKKKALFSTVNWQGSSERDTLVRNLHITGTCMIAECHYPCTGSTAVTKSKLAGAVGQAVFLALIIDQ